jgi:RNA polymerase sigma factor (sigma-70 family)
VEAMGKSGAAVLERPDGAAGPTDHELVRRVRLGDERAFEALYSRYQRRIAAYVYGMVKDHGRAEDVTQEVFVSALRRMCQTERPIAFKPWIYEIAKNACIDAYRRGHRAEEVSFDADDRLSPSDYGRLVATAPGPDAAIDTKQELDNLCGAFGGLSDTHHEILVMRELEGLSYKDIGERLGMSRAAVESTLFRARKRLGEEYDDLASGARCLRIQAIIAGADAAPARLGLRDRRKLARHVSHCQPCRRLAAHAGLDVPVPARTRIAERIAGWLPLPAFLRLRRGGEDAAAVAGGGGGRWTAQFPLVADSLQSGWSKAAAGAAAILVAGAGAGVTTSLLDKRDERGTGVRPAVERTAQSGGGVLPRPAAPAAGAEQRGPARGERSSGAKAERKRGDRDRTAPSGGGADTDPAPAQTTPAADRGGGPAGDDRAAGGGERTSSASDALPSVDVPDVDLPAAGGTGQKLGDAVDQVDQTLQDAGTNLGDTVDKTVENVGATAQDPANLLPNAEKTAGDAIDGVAGTTGAAVDGVAKTVDGLLSP